MGNAFDDLVLRRAMDEYERQSMESANCGSPFDDWADAEEDERQEFIDYVRDVCMEVVAAWNTRTPNLSALDSDEAVEVVARAIAINSYHENGLETMCYAGQEDFANREQHHYLRDAKAAIQAVRGMLEAGRG